MSLPAERIGIPVAGAGRSLSPALTFSYKLLVRRAKKCDRVPNERIDNAGAVAKHDFGARGSVRRVRPTQLNQRPGSACHAAYH